MKKIALSAFVIITFLAYALHSQAEGSSGSLVTPVPVSGQSGISMGGQNGTQSSGSSSHTNVSPATFKDGSYTGDVADAYYGYVQVQVTVSGGKISDLRFLDYPHDRRTSEFINQQAMPYLKQEAIQAQTAQVDTVSGATQTSRAFRQSLQSALAKAAA